MLLIIFASGTFLSATHGSLRETITKTQLSNVTQTATQTLTQLSNVTQTATQTLTQTATATTTAVSTSTFTATATQTLSSTVTATATMNVTTTVPPKVQILASPTSGRPTNSVVVVGHGFQPHSNVIIRFGNTTPVFSALVNADGSFGTSFLVPSVGKGLYVLTANDDFGNQASVNFTVL
jgi:hypothetical protein